MPEIALESGFTIRTYAPPRGFDPLTASPAGLERHGFPARPEDPHHLARYRVAEIGRVASVADGDGLSRVRSAAPCAGA